MNDEIESLKELLKQREAQIDIQAQENHGLRSQLKVLKDMQCDYQAEIELIQSLTDKQLAEQHARHAEHVQKLTDSYAHEKMGWEKTYECLEVKLKAQEASIAIHLAELKQSSMKAEDADCNSVTAILHAENNQLKETIAENHQVCQQHQELNHLLLQSKSTLSKELENSKEHLTVTQEKLNILKAEFSEQAAALEELRATLVATHNELASLKSKPSDEEARGNSLFSEVEDKRQAMLKRFSTLNSRYHQMKSDYAAKCEEIYRLKAEKVQLCRKWEDEQDKRLQTEVWLTDNFQIRIKELQAMISQLKSSEKPIFITGDSEILKYADHVVQSSRKGISELREEMEWRSAERLNEAKALYSARRELETFRTRVTTLEAENRLLLERLKGACENDLFSGINVETQNTKGISVKEERSIQFTNPKLYTSTTESSTARKAQSVVSEEDVVHSKIDKSSNVNGTAVELSSSSLQASDSISGAVEPHAEASNFCVSQPIKTDAISDSSSSCWYRSESEHSPDNSSVSSDSQFMNDHALHSTRNGALLSSNMSDLSPTLLKHTDESVTGLKTINDLSKVASYDLSCVGVKRWPLAGDDLQKISCGNDEASAFLIAPRQAGKPELISHQNIPNSKEEEGGLILDGHQSCVNVKPAKSILSNSSLAYQFNFGPTKPTRKVCFDVENCASVLEPQSENKNEKCILKRSSRIPAAKSYRTMFIVSKENVESPH